MNKKHKGAVAELKATAWLLQQGYEVFRNVSPYGPYDIIAIKDDIIEKIDVKTASCYTTINGKLRFYKGAKSQQGAKMLIYCYEMDKLWWKEDYNVFVESQPFK